MDEGTEAQALQEEYRRVSGGAEVCVRCGQVFSAADSTARSLGCSYHSGDYVASKVVETDAEGAASLHFFTCCQAREETFWGGAPLYDTLIPLVRRCLPSPPVCTQCSAALTLDYGGRWRRVRST